MNLALHIKCWVFPFMLKIPHLPLIIVIFVSPFLDEYLSIAFLPQLFIKYRHQGPDPERLPNTLHKVAPYRINQPGPDALKHSASPWQPGFSISTHTTSNPNAEFPPSNRRGGTYQRFSVICATAWAAKGLGELPWMWGWRNISIPFFFFFFP